MGDPGGIGPEVALKALSRSPVRTACRGVIVGDLAYLRSLAQGLRIPAGLRGISDFSRASGEAIYVHDVIRVAGKPLAGRPSRAGGHAAGKSLARAVELALGGQVEGLVTAPVSKESFALAGYGMVGHTEIIARLTGTRNYAMMLTNGDLRVIFATTHVAHRNVASRLSRRGLANKIRLAHRYLALYLGIENARIAVACLNPHCGEGGRLGREEKTVIEPALEALRAKGIDVDGPFAADSIYRRTIAGRFDAIIAMYHDQGMIPLKLKGHGQVINVTLGVPVVRTSPGHGTAFDIAGTGRASPVSMSSAIIECAKVAKRLRRG
jgi:4-hydroxythreonine-4-phosphate dehydrogenase